MLTTPSRASRPPPGACSHAGAHGYVVVMLRTLLIVLALLMAGPLSSGRTAVHGQDVDRGFEHAAHDEYTCADCHTMEVEHGSLLVRGTADCRGCHHTGERLDRGCVACHDVDGVADIAVPLTRVFEFSVRPDARPARDLVFDHRVHADRACVECHVDDTSQSAAALDCAGCHEEHHAAPPESCWSCHVRPPEGAHTVEVHRTCSGAGCHTDSPISSPTQTRAGCMLCHEDQANHEPGGECVDCHLLGSSARSTIPAATGGPHGRL